MDEDQPPVLGPRLVVDNGRTSPSEPRYARPPNALRARMTAIADLINVPLTTFFDESAARARTGTAPDGPPTMGELVELQTLFGQVRNPRGRQDCLDFIRALAGPPET